MPFIPTSLSNSLEVISAFNTGLNVLGANTMPFAAASDDKLTYALGTGTLEQLGAFFSQFTLAPSANMVFNFQNLQNSPSNFFTTLSFSLIKQIIVRLIPNVNASPGSIGIKVGGDVASGTGNDQWDGWLSPGGYEVVDIGGTPYNKSSDTGRAVGPHSNLFQITNLDSVNEATVWMGIGGY